MAEYGHRHIIEWLRDIGVFWDERAITRAAKSGHLSLIKWLVESGCLWDDQAIIEASVHGQLEVVKWLMNNVGHYSKARIQRDKEHGYNTFEQMKIRKETGCHWNSLIIEYASYHDQQHIIDWIEENPCPGNCL